MTLVFQTQAQLKQMGAKSKKSMARLFFVQTVYVLFELKKLPSKQDATVHLLSLLESLPFGNIVRESRLLQAKDLRL